LFEQREGCRRIRRCHVGFDGDERDDDVGLAVDDRNGDGIDRRHRDGCDVDGDGDRINQHRDDDAIG
jgi:hypothetical protein